MKTNFKGKEDIEGYTIKNIPDSSFGEILGWTDNQIEESKYEDISEYYHSNYQLSCFHCCFSRIPKETNDILNIEEFNCQIEKETGKVCLLRQFEFYEKNL